MSTTSILPDNGLSLMDFPSSSDSETGISLYDDSSLDNYMAVLSHLPIRYALGYPERLPSSGGHLSLSQYSTLSFEEPDMEKFPLLGFAFDAIEMGGNMPCILNAANEVAVAAFLRGELHFCDMPSLVARTMETTPFIPSVSLDDLVQSNQEAIARAKGILGSVTKN